VLLYPESGIARNLKFPVRGEGCARGGVRWQKKCEPTPA
jgi:hypothetical protein